MRKHINFNWNLIRNVRSKYFFIFALHNKTFLFHRKISISQSVTPSSTTLCLFLFIIFLAYKRKILDFFVYQCFFGFLKHIRLKFDKLWIEFICYCIFFFWNHKRFHVIVILWKNEFTRHCDDFAVQTHNELNWNLE